MTQIVNLAKKRDVDSEMVMEYVGYRIPFDLMVDRYVVIEEAFIEKWNSTDEYWGEEEMIDRVKDKLKKKAILMDDEKVEIIVKLIIQALVKYGHLKFIYPETILDRLQEAGKRKHILEDAIRRYKLNEELSKVKFRTWQELEEELKKCKIDPPTLLIKMDIPVASYTLYILQEWILPEKMTIEEGMAEMIKAEDHLFDIETMLWPNTDRKTIWNHLIKEHQLRYILDFLHYHHVNALETKRKQER